MLLPKASALSDDEKALVRDLHRRLGSQRKRHHELDLTYQGRQMVTLLGLAIPPDLRGFEFPLNWNRVYVDAIEHRQDVRALLRPGGQRDDEALREGWDFNDLDSQASLVHRETLVQGHGFVTVSTNEDDPGHPFIRAESSRHMIARIDPRRRRMEAALRLYSDPWKVWAPDRATLYLPDSTVWLEREGSGPWVVTNRDDHRLGRVPVVMFLNRPRVGEWTGETEMADVMPIVTMATRVLANLQYAAERVATPKLILTRAQRQEFRRPDGTPKDEWEAYMDALWATAADMGVHQIAAADLENFIRVITMLAQQASSVTGLPMRYFGQNPANPATEGAIRADESRLVKTVERKNREYGSAWGWVMGLYERFRTGEWTDGEGRITVEWHDPGTPTFAQKMDAIQKGAGGVPLFSRQGSWDEMGWSEARKQRELQYFAEESDPGAYLGLLEAKEAAQDATDADAAADDGGVRPE